MQISANIVNFKFVLVGGKVHIDKYPRVIRGAMVLKWREVCPKCGKKAVMVAYNPLTVHEKF